MTNLTYDNKAWHNNFVLSKVARVLHTWEGGVPQCVFEERLATVHIKWKEEYIELKDKNKLSIIRNIYPLLSLNVYAQTMF